MQPNNQIPQNTQDNQLYPPNPYASQQFTAMPMNGTLAPPPQQNNAKPSVGLVVGIVMLTLLLLTSVVLAGVFYMQMQDYKNNSDQKSATAVGQAKEQQKKELEQVFAEQSKEPLVSYASSPDIGGVIISYPKTWSAYINEKGSSQLLDAYFHPNYVPASSGAEGSFNYALRAQILQQNYQTVSSEFKDKIKTGKVTATPLTGLPSGGTGIRIDGEIANKKNGSLIIIPVRDKVLKVWTEGDQFKNDFNNFVLKNLKYNP